MNANQRSRTSAVLIAVIAVLFYIFFMHAKHDPALSKVNAFADDPYDAVGSFGIQAAMFLALVCVIRTFRSRTDARALEHGGFLLRAETAAILSVGVTLAADALAMLRYLHLWIGAAAGYRLAALLAGMAIITGAVGLGIRRTADIPLGQASSAAWVRAVVGSVFMALVLVFYPQHFRRGLIGVLSTAFIGTLVLFAPVWAWTMALVPHVSAHPEQHLTTSEAFHRRKYHWLVVILVGVLVGLFFVAGEASEGSGIPRAKLALVISAYIGLETAGLIVGYAFLGKSLGLFRKRSL